MIRLETARLVLRPWEERDRDLFFEINADDAVMEYFPFRRTREQADAMFDDWLRRQHHELLFQAVEIANTGECAGFCGLYPADAGGEAPHAAGEVEIGWRLATRHWGKGYATESARRWLEHGFTALELPEIVSFAVENNQRSTAVMERIGMRRDRARDFDHPDIPETHRHLKRHAFYRLSANEWRMKKGGQPG